MNALLRAAERLCVWVEGLAQGERWVARTALLATALALLCSFPRPDTFWRAGSAPEWAPLLGKIERPLAPQPELAAASHGAKTAFRLVPPLVGHALSLGPLGLKLLEALCGVALLACVAVGAERAAGDRRCAVLVTLLVASCFPGVTAFVEHRGFFDGVALCGLAAACATRHPLGILAGLALAHWTDERAVIASGLVALVHLADTPREAGIRRLPDPRVLAVGVALASYAALRLFLGSRYGLSTPTAGTGARFLVNQVNNAPLGLWTGLEGGWLLVLAAGAALARAGRRALLLAGLAAGGAVALVALSVWDITRSMAYLLPGLFLALRVLRDHEPAPELLLLCRAGFLLALLWPNYYTAGKGETSWLYPLPLMLWNYFKG
ncbi:MAG: hypothetical protein AB7N76_35130 [Planctomycetota bacterium]